MNKQGGPKLATFVGVTLMAGSLGIFLISQGTGNVRAAAQNKTVTDAIMKIADEFKKGNTAGAKTQAEAFAKTIEDLDEVMDLLKPRKKNGVGVGKVPGAIVPDGIEQMLITLGRDAPGAGTMAKQAEALEEMSYVISAIAEVAIAKPPTKFAAKQNKKDWMTWSTEVRSSALEFAKAAKAKGAQDVHSAAKKMNNACNSCHTVFRN